MSSEVLSGYRLEPASIDLGAGPQTMLTQKPPFSAGDLPLLNLTATLEVALQEKPQASHSENENKPNGIDNSVLVVPASLDIATGSVCGGRPMHSSLGSCRRRRRAGLRTCLRHSAKEQ